MLRPKLSEGKSPEKCNTLLRAATCHPGANGFVLFGELLDLAADLTAFLDHHFAVANFSGYLAGRVHGEVFPDGEFAREPAADFRNIDAGGAREGAAGRNLNHSAVHRGLDVAFDDQRVAVGDLDAFQLDIRADDEAAALLIVALGRRGGRRFFCRLERVPGGCRGARQGAVQLRGGSAEAGQAGASLWAFRAFLVAPAEKCIALEHVDPLS